MPILVAVLLLVPVLAQAATIRVPDHQPTIFAGLAVAVEGDTVEVACGTYYEHDLVLPPGVALVSESRSPSCVTIDAEQLGRVLLSSGGEAESRLEGLTLTRGHIGNDSGGGLHLRGVSLVMRNCHVLDNSCDGGGGGIRADETSLMITESLLSGNVASVGGGLGFTSGTLELSDSVVRDNWGSSHNSGSGGGLSAGGSSVSIVRCRIEDNNSGSVGTGGGAVIGGGNAFLSGNVFYHNSAGHCGAVAFTGDATVHIFANTFARNGGDVALAGLGSPTIEFENCLISRNWGAAMGFWGGWNGSVAFSCTDIQGNETDWSGPLEDQADINGNFSADPLFCDDPAGDLHLQWGSPCLPENSSGCGLVGALGFGGCNSVAIRDESWARVKGRYR